MAVVTAERELVSRPETGASAEEICKVLLEKRAVFIGLIQRFENSMDHVEDILALATVEALACASQFKGDSALSSYIGSIVLNAARNYASRQRVRKNSMGVFFEHELGRRPGSDSGDTDDDLDLDAIQEVGQLESPSPEKLLEQRQLLGQVGKVLERIKKRWPEAYRIWHMHRLDELSYTEIFEATGVKPSTARIQVHRIATKLTEEMDKMAA